MNVYLLYGLIVATVLAILYVVYRNWNVETSTLFSFFRAVSKGYARGGEQEERKNPV